MITLMHSEEHKRKISESLKKTLAGRQWNSGLTKHDHPSIASMARKRTERSRQYETLEYREKMRRIALENDYGQWMKGKRLSIQTREKLSAMRQQEKHPGWRGDEVGYSGVHKWVESQLGKPKVCEHCGSDSKKKYEWCNKDHKYRRIIEDWMRLCTSCHRKYDLMFNSF